MNRTAVRRNAIQHAAIVRTFQQTSDDCAGFIATWLRAAAKNKNYWGKHFDHVEKVIAITTGATPDRQDTGATWHVPRNVVVENYVGKPVLPRTGTKANKIEQFEKRDRDWALNQARARHKGGTEFGINIRSARNPRLGTYICYGAKTLLGDEIEERTWLLDFVGDTVLDKGSSGELARDLARMFEDSFQNRFFSFYGLSSQTKGHAVGLYRQGESACYFDSNVGEFTMSLDNFLRWFRENWENFEYPFTRLNGMNFKLHSAQ